MTSAAHRGRRQTDTCGAAKRQRARNGEWKRQTLLAAKRGQIARLRGRTGRGHLRGDKRKRQSAGRAVYLPEKREELSASTKREYALPF